MPAWADRHPPTTNPEFPIKKAPAGMRLWETPEGQFWISAGDKRGEELTLLLAEQMIHIYGDGAAGVQPGDIVIDCGAHIGLFTREALSRGAKLVVAVEPAPLTRLLLERNLRKDIDAGRVVIYTKGVWDSETTMQFQTDSGGGAVGQVLDLDHHDVLKLGGVIEVPLTTIDKLVSELKLDQVDFIKMDIEGAEQRALAGATRTLQAYKPRMAIASYHEPDDQVRIPEIVLNARADYSFRCGPCGPLDGVIVPKTILFK